MSTGYAIVQLSRDRDGEWQSKVVEVVWREDEAVEKVERLNATGTTETARDLTRYVWQTTWVARRPSSAAAVLTPDDREKLELARKLGALNTERPLSVFFSFIFNLPGALAACEELRTLGWPDPDCDEEVTDDDLWHVFAGRRLVINEESISSLRVEMEQLAERHGGTYDGWDVTGSRSLRHASPGELPT
jgi:hypothetical protein